MWHSVICHMLLFMLGISFFICYLNWLFKFYKQIKLRTILIMQLFHSYNILSNSTLKKKIWTTKANFKMWSIAFSASISCPSNWLPGSPLPCGERSSPRYLWKHTFHANYRNCKVDIFKRQGRSGGMYVKPLLFHYTIRTCDVKPRSHADNIIGSLYGRSKSMTPFSPWERWGS